MLGSEAESTMSEEYELVGTASITEELQVAQHFKETGI